MLFGRFAEHETERNYLRLERSGRAPALRALIVIGALTLVSYMVLNPAHFDAAGALAYERAARWFLIVMGGLFVLTFTQFYLDRPWIDLPVFVAAGAAMVGITDALNRQSHVTGFPDHAMALVQLAILMVFAGIAFAGTVRLFVASSAVVLALFAAWLISLDALAISKIYSLTNFSTFLLFALYVNWDTDRRARGNYAADLALAAERAKTEALLYNVLPHPVVERLKAGEEVADRFAALTVVFADIVDSATIARSIPPERLVRLLNRFFSLADEAAARHGLEKVKTVGDAYMAVAGGTASGGAGTADALAFARDLIAAGEPLSAVAETPVRLRVGIHRGSAVGGVIGSARLAYDYWGDTINLASRLQGVAPPGGIALSEAALAEAGGSRAAPRVIDLKGIGETRVFVIEAGA